MKMLKYNAIACVIGALMFVPAAVQVARADDDDWEDYWEDREEAFEDAREDAEERWEEEQEAIEDLREDGIIVRRPGRHRYYHYMPHDGDRVYHHGGRYHGYNGGPVYRSR